ncbi:MAG: glucose-1-phosphate adenylyltransferase [Arenicellales bacterium]
MVTPEQRSARFVSLITRDTLALVLAGGRGTRLGALTRHRAKPAVPFGGKYRLIDFPLSNCINSGIRRVGVLTQYKAHSLIRHLQQGWGFLKGEFGEFIDILPAQQRAGEHWYLGTADAVYQNLDIIRGLDPQFVLILGGDHVYKMDYGNLLAYHLENRANVTVACVQVPLREGREFGIMSTQENGRVRGFAEKPQDPEPVPGVPDRALASMGIYVFNTEYLVDALSSDAAEGGSTHDFGHDIVPRAVQATEAFAFPFTNFPTDERVYWRDVGNLDAFWASNLELIGARPELNLYDADWPIWTLHDTFPPAKFAIDAEGRAGVAEDSMVASGCIIVGATARHSVLFANVRAEPGAEIEQCVIFHDAVIGARCRLRRVVIDSRCTLPADTVIGYDRVQDAQRFEVSANGIVLVTPEMLGQTIHHV